MKYLKLVRALIAFGGSYDQFTVFLTYGTMWVAVVNEWLWIWNFVHKEVMWIVEYPESFRQNECILLEIMDFRKTTIFRGKFYNRARNSRFLKIHYLKKDALVLSENFWIFYYPQDLFMDKISDPKSLIYYCYSHCAIGQKNSKLVITPSGSDKGTNQLRVFYYSLWSTR
jgi:hypothetical protein